MGPNNVWGHSLKLKKIKDNSFSQRAIDIIKKIPSGRVATYGQIAMMAGNHRASRQIAWILHSLSEKKNLPWHRVVNRNGKISLKRKSGYEFQKKLLQEEGIIFEKNEKIDFNVFLWEPMDKKPRKGEEGNR